MKELSQFGYWDLAAEPSPLLKVEPLSWAGAPLPRFVGLMKSAKLRLMQGLATEQPAEAAKEVRQLAWLCFQTETLIGGMVATAMLGMEASAAKAWAEGGHPPVDGWTPMTQPQVDELKAWLWATNGYLSAMTEPALRDRLARAGLEWAATFRWDDCGRRTIDALVGEAAR